MRDHGGCGRQLPLIPGTEPKGLLLASLFPLTPAGQTNAGSATGHVCESMDMLDSLMEAFPALGLGGAWPLKGGQGEAARSSVSKNQLARAACQDTRSSMA